MDTSVVRNFRLQRAKVAFALLCFTAAFVAGIAMIWTPLTEPHAGRTIAGGWIVVLLCPVIVVPGVCRFFLLWKRPVLIVAPTGLTDRRVSKVTVPWTDVLAVEDKAYFVRGMKQRVIRLKLSPAAETAFYNGWWSKYVRAWNKFSGLDGAVVSATALPISHEELLKQIRAYADCYGSPTAVPRAPASA